MGKPRKKVVASSSSKGEEKQAKISSFFGSKQVVKAESSLFTKIQTDTTQSVVKTSSTERGCKDNRHKDEHNAKKQVQKSSATLSQSSVKLKHNKDDKENNDEDVVFLGCNGVQHKQPSVKSSKGITKLTSKETKDGGSKRETILLSEEDENPDSLKLCTNIPSKVPEKHQTSDRTIPLVESGAEADICGISFSPLTTPEKNQQDQVSDSSPEVICDTPGVDLELQEARERRRKLYNSRSFLRSSDLLAVQPGLKPAHLRIQGKARPRKLLGTVSVSFKEKSKSETTSVSSSASCVESGLSNAGDCKDTEKKSDHTDMAANLEPLSIPETQIQERPGAQSKGAENMIEQYDSDEDEQPEHVFDQSAHELDVTVEKYLCAMDSLESADVGSNDVAESSEMGGADNHIHRFPAKSMSWDRGEVLKDKETYMYTNPTYEHGSKISEPLNIKSKLIGALETAEERAKEQEEKLWLKERIVKDILQNHSTSKDKETTPVKMYPGKALKIKRQAKSGGSPQSKRVHTSDYPGLVSVDDLNDQVADQAKKVLSYDTSLSTAHPVKSSSKKCQRFTRQRALEFGFKPKEKSPGSGKNVTLKDDKLLADLLVGINSPGDNTNQAKGKSIDKHCSGNGDMNSYMLNSRNSKKSVKTKVLREDEKLLDALFGESFVGRDIEMMEKSPPPSPIKEHSGPSEQTQPILIEESQNPQRADSDVCIIIDEDSNNSLVVESLDTCVKNGTNLGFTEKESFNKASAPEERTISTGHGSPVAVQVGRDEREKVVADVDKLSPQDQPMNGQSTLEGAAVLQEAGMTNDTRAESLSTPSHSSVITNNIRAERLSELSHPSADIHDTRAESLSKLSHPSPHHYQAHPDHAMVHTSKPATTESKAPSSCKEEDHLSTSICDMLSESFDSEFLAPQPQAEAVDKRKLDFVFTDLWNRFSVTDVTHHREADELLLDLHCERTKVRRQCVLRGFWVDTEVERGDVVNVLAEQENGKFFVDDKKGLVVVNPDILLSGTLVVSAVFCPRKSVLNEQFKGVDKGNVAMLYGNILHSLFQEVLRGGISREKDIEALAVSRLKSSKFLHEMYGQNVAESTVMEEVNQYIPSLMEWLSKHTSISSTGARSVKSGKKSDLMVTEIQDIEENIWSPRFGLKGKIDLTVQAKLTAGNAKTEVKVLPLELKTGKASFSSEHKGQVTLYSMMCSDRRADPHEGILLYLKQGQMETVQAKPESKSGLIQLRNKLARDLSRQVTMETDEAGSKTYLLGCLPQPINNERACSKCAHLQTCSIYQRAAEKVEHPPDHPMSRLVPEALAHLGEPDLTYFLHWVLCLDVEAQQSSRRQLQHIWGSNSLYRERDGECLSNLVITGSELGIPESQSFNDGKGCSLTFSRHPSSQGEPLNTVGLTAGDMVVLSSEDGRLIALATGFVRNISATLVEIVVDRDYLHTTAAYKDVRFRLDRNDSFSTSGYLYTNLAKLMDPTPQGVWLRDLIVKKRPPEFELKVSKSSLYKVKSVFKPLNKPQRTAILKVLMAKDYVLIKGFPGTGKTSTIVALVKILHLLGLSVLLTSYTHSAVDNILLKLKKEEVPFVRLGRQGRIHPSIVPHCAERLTQSSHIDSVQALREFYSSYGVVATSCLGVSNHPVFSQRHFDVCIVDEASQVLQPACLAPLFHCRKFVLVGDPKQLPPVVQSKEARKLGMDTSLFARLDNSGATYDLSLQYRMNRVIMDLSNKLVYEGMLQCGDSAVAEQCLKLDSSALEDQPQWIQAALSPQIESSVVFVDTSQISAPEIQDGHGVKNDTEAHIILSLLQALIDGQVPAGSVGVISPYRSQVKLLQQMVAECPAVTGVEVNTVDQYQGRDKGVIVVSFVRSKLDNIGQLLKDLRRLNVALTRARYKLILVGNSPALKVYENLTGLFDWLHKSQNIVMLPEDYTLDT